MRAVLTRLLYIAQILLLLFSFPVSALGPPDFPAPPKAVVEWVGKDMQVNGLPTSIRAFHSNESIEDVVKFYRREWQRPVERGKPGFMESIDSYPWYIISRVEDDYLLTVQVQVKQNDKSGSWGYLSISPLFNPRTDPPDLGKGVPKMRGSHILSEHTSNDPGKKARTLIITNEHSVPSNVTFYRNYYNGKGWTMETDRALGTDKVHSLVFKTKRDRVTMMFLKDEYYTRIVINAVTNSLF